MVTYEEASNKINEEEQERERQNRGPRGQHIEETLEELSSEYPDISVTSPNWLSSVRDDLTTDPRRPDDPFDWMDPGDTGDVNIDIPGFPDLGQLPGMPDTDMDLDGLGQTGLLQVIAELMSAQVRVNAFNSRLLAANLVTQFDIADAVEPMSGIVVSGTNAIESADVAQPVIPQSDSKNIPTRSLFIRADRSNGEAIAFGDDETSPNSGFVLESGESIVIEMDLSVSVLYMASIARGQQVNIMGMI